MRVLLGTLIGCVILLTSPFWFWLVLAYFIGKEVLND